MTDTLWPRHYAARIVRRLRYEWKIYPDELTPEQWGELLADAPAEWRDLVRLHVEHTAQRSPHIKRADR